MSTRSGWISRAVAAVLVLGALAQPAHAAKGDGISGAAAESGHNVTWTTTGAYAFPASMKDYANSYDAYSYLGQTVVVRGQLDSTATSSNRYMISFATMSGGGMYGWKWVFPAQDVRKGITQSAGLSLPFELTAPIPTVAETVPADQQAIGVINVQFRSVDCEPVTWANCVGVNLRSFSIVVLRTPPKEAQPSKFPAVNLPQFTKIITTGDQRKAFPTTTPFPVRIPYRLSNPTGKARMHIAIFSDGNVVSKYDSQPMPQGKYSYLIKKRPPGPGPYFLCLYAEDDKGNRGTGNTCTWLSIVVPANLFSNGCGSDGVAQGWVGAAALWVQNFTGNKRLYGKGAHRVAVEIACNIHDAAYAGVTIFDPIARKYIDFRTWSRLRVDEKFKADIQRQCRISLTLPAEKEWLPTCLEGLTLAQVKEFMLVTSPTEGPLGAWNLLQDKIGAQLYFDLVRTEGGVGFDADVVTPGTQPVMPSSTNPAGGNRQAS